MTYFLFAVRLLMYQRPSVLLTLYVLYRVDSSTRYVPQVAKTERRVGTDFLVREVALGIPLFCDVDPNRVEQLS